MDAIKTCITIRMAPRWDCKKSEVSQPAWMIINLTFSNSDIFWYYMNQCQLDIAKFWYYTNDICSHQTCREFLHNGWLLGNQHLSKVFQWHWKVFLVKNLSAEIQGKRHCTDVCEGCHSGNHTWKLDYKFDEDEYQKYQCQQHQHLSSPEGGSTKGILLHKLVCRRLCWADA